MIFALLHTNFHAWNYPSPRVFRHKSVRILTIATLWIVPMKMEILSVRTVMRLQVLPSLRTGRVGFACRTLLRLVACRWAMMWLLAAEARPRFADEKKLLELL
jgi:hypothetical protein